MWWYQASTIDRAGAPPCRGGVWFQLLAEPTAWVFLERRRALRFGDIGVRLLDKEGELLYSPPSVSFFA